jgi:putative ABC transport system substrate-binding protein
MRYSRTKEAAGIGRRAFIALLGGTIASLFARPRAAHAQPAGKVWRLGVLEVTAPAMNAANFDALRKGLRALGYVEGRNLTIEYRSADGRTERFPELAAELVGLKVDVIVTRGTPAVLAAKNATTTIPVVMAAIGEPLLTGVVAGLARPGGNVTGLSAFTLELLVKRIEILREAVPGLTRIAFLHNLANPTAPRQWEELKTAAPTLGIELRLLDVRDVRNVEDMERVFATAVAQRVHALVVGNDTVTQMNRRLVVELAARHRLPAMYLAREFVDAGGLMTYGVSYADLYRRAATFVDKIFKGAKPADLPVEQPTKIELVVNLKTAKALGLTVPPTLLARADEVIE